jgi:hypothetical protein
VARFRYAGVDAAADGAGLCPGARLFAVVDGAVELEGLVAWIMDVVRRGARLPGLYPPDETNRARYEASRKPPPAA